MMSERRTSGGLTNTTDTECPDDEGDLDPRIQVKKKRPLCFIYSGNSRSN